MSVMNEPLSNPTTGRKAMIDPFGRAVTYLRVSVTDRCDFRCVYCMSEHMTFLPKQEVLSLEELEKVCGTFIDKGVRKIRLTGGEPLVRKDIMVLIRNLGDRVKSGDLDELTITTNGSQLARFSEELYSAGVRRLNVSVDTLDEAKFADITRWGRLPQVLDGIDAAQKAGLKIKLNAVALKDVNEQEIPDMISWAHERGHEMTLIETMPMGDIDGDRTDQYLPLSKVREDLEKKWTLVDLPDRTGGPARYVRIEETGGRLGFITPLTHNFCESCNRVRLTCTGQLYMCLGQDDDADLRAAVRSDDPNLLSERIDEAIGRKPKGHDFIIDRENNGPAVSRHMSHTGG